MEDEEAKKRKRLERARELYQQGHFGASTSGEASASPGRGRGISFSVGGRGDDGRGRRGQRGARGLPFARGGARPGPRPAPPTTTTAQTTTSNKNNNTATAVAPARKVWQPKSARALDFGATSAVPVEPEGPALTTTFAGDDSVERPRLALQRASDYEVLSELGKGQFGVVTRARLKRRRSEEDKTTPEVVAMKQLRFDFDKEGFPLEALREITLLSSLRHPNIVSMHAVAFGDGEAPDEWYLVMEPAGHELTTLVKGARRRPFTEAQVKHLMVQLLRALAALHSVWVMHRDLKTPNVLVDDHGNLRLCDFGLARRVACGPELFEFDARGESIANIELYGGGGGGGGGGDNKPATTREMAYATTHTPNVISGHYRPPEVLLGCRDYGRSVDVWSAGCIFGELLSRTVLFAGKDEPDQLRQIFTLLGEPTAQEWPLYPHLARARGFRFESATGHDLHRRLQIGGTELLRRRFPERGFDGAHAPLNTVALVNPLGHVTTSLSNTGFALLCRTLETCPERRVTANDAKRDRWFSSRPVPEPLAPNDIAPLVQLAPLADLAPTVPQFATTGFSNQPLPPLLVLAQAAGNGLGHLAAANFPNFAHPSAATTAPATAPNVAAVPLPASFFASSRFDSISPPQALAIARARALALGGGGGGGNTSRAP
ncbi:hypothetical protein CTAYLR_007450 [Chrysophaeum taylorii]|uniref:Cyclin-dependent kinase 2 homolog n=1 Tax=Chrysophaeum taylorii TaxID=2483200 RepID=A0AAD7UD01_9STRA|nr:hypothetical protein CTAYLR_007450 [Chrysophaeum taylorii]